MSIRTTTLAAILAAGGAACTSRHMVLPEKAVTSGSYDYGQVTLVVRSFEIKGASSKDDVGGTLPELRASFAEYVGAQCRFRNVLFGKASVEGPSIGVDVEVSAEHSSSRTWILDWIGIHPLWPLVPQWGAAHVAVAVAADSVAARWTAEGAGSADYSMYFYSWWRTAPVETAYRNAYGEAFSKVSRAFCADTHTVRVAQGGSSAPFQRQEPAAAAVPVSAPAPAPAPAPREAQQAVSAGKVAVLDFRNYSKDLQKENVQYFTDLVRGVVLKGAPRFNVITRENLLVLLQASGKDLASCEGECEVDTGRRIGADVIVSGDIQKVGTRYKISLRMHETRDGRLIATSIASGGSVDALDDAATKAASDLVEPIH